MNGELVELPITLPQDHTLFSILGERDERLWVAKTEHIRRRGGMALALTHPDYADGWTPRPQLPVLSRALPGRSRASGTPSRAR